MKKILITVMAVALCLGLMGGAFAYFSDIGTSTDNTFTAGTLTVELGGSDGNAIWVSPTNWAPGEMVTDTITLQNSGTVDIGWIGIKPVSVTVVGATPEDFPDKIIITNFSMSEAAAYNKSIPNIASSMANWGIWGPQDGELTLADFASGNFYFYTEPDPVDWNLLANNVNTVSLTMEFQFDPEAENDYQSAQLTFELEVVVLQLGSGGPANFTHIGDAGCGYGY